MGSVLALLGGPKSVSMAWEEAVRWPVITEEDEAAVLEVLRSGDMSGIGVTEQFEREFGEFFGMPYCLAHCNGTAALQAAMFACGVGLGDEIIVPGMTYWASALPCLSLGATVVFADIDPNTLNIDPKDIPFRITQRTKAIVVVHYAGYPCEMEAIMAIAKKHGIHVIEDVSHAQGSLYRGMLTGTIGDISAMSLMSQKSLVAGEAGMLMTRDRTLWERAVAWGHYERHTQLTDPSLVPYQGLPMGGVKHRLNQLASGLGRSQLKRYHRHMQVTQEAMNHFWDLLDGCPGLHAHRPSKESGSTMGGWYAAKGLYRRDELKGLPIGTFCEAVCAEGSSSSPGANAPLHTHPLLNDCDIYGHGRPTRLAYADGDVRQRPGSLPVVESIGEIALSVPHFVQMRKEIIEEHAAAFRKVAEHADELVATGVGTS